MQHTFMAKNPSVLWFLLGLSLFTVFVTIFSEAVGSTGVSTSFLKTSGQDVVPMPCCHRDGRGLGLLWYFEPWTFCLLWDRWLRHRHVADV